MSEQSETEPDVFEDPEVKEVLLGTIGAVQNESDRGAVLICAEFVNDHLTRLFEKITPSTMTKKERERVLEYPGCLASFAAKNDVAFLTGLIGHNVYSSINTLRKVRNGAAHSAVDFSLIDHKARIHEMYELLGQGISGVIKKMAVEMVTASFVSSVLQTQAAATDEISRTLFKGHEDVIDALLASPTGMNILEGKSARIELGVAVTLMCGLLLAHRRKALKRNDPNKCP